MPFIPHNGSFSEEKLDWIRRTLTAFAGLSPAEIPNNKYADTNYGISKTKITNKKRERLNVTTVAMYIGQKDRMRAIVRNA